MPSVQKRYKSAPITEAVIEIRIEPHVIDKDALNRVAAALKADFPKQAPMQLLRMGIVAESDPEYRMRQTVAQSNIGSRLVKADDSRVLQIRSDGMAYSHMAPYSEWKVFRAEAEPLWKQYRQICVDARLVRCALRYINRIDVPGTKIELEDYFSLRPHIPENLPERDLMGMALSLQLPQQDLQCVAILNHAMLEPKKPEHLSFLIDIDIFREGIQSWADSDVWTYLDKLRDRKNEIFEACITDRTRELIDR